jgi:flagellar biosynthesis/type III secretory pathway protein FliH
MPSYKNENFQIDREHAELDGQRIVKVETPSSQQVSSFEPAALSAKGKGDYSATRKKFGSLAATDAARASRAQKDVRFSLSPLLRKPLSVEEEEKRAIEEKVRARVAAKADEVREMARTQGYEEGLKKGYEEAFKRFQQEGAERLARFERLLAETEQAKQEIFRANERYLIELVFRIGRMVLLRELKTDRELILRLATELIERVGVRENIRIKINPDDQATIEMLKAGIEQSMGAMKNLTIEVSNQIKGGGCAVETEWNAIDASIETQLQGLYDSLIGQVAAK